HGLVAIAEVRVRPGSGEGEAEGGALARQWRVELAVPVLWGSGGHRVRDVVCVGPGDPRARLHLDGSGLELKRLDGDVRIRPEGSGGAEGTGQEERGEHLYGRTRPFGFGGQRGRPDRRQMDIHPYRHYGRRHAPAVRL